MWVNLLLMFLILYPNSLKDSPKNQKELIVWNVGQGQWISLVEANHCWHFDMGGEFLPFKEILKRCKKKENQIFISHGDWDHINGIKKYTRLQESCIHYKTHPLSTKKALLKNIPPCPQLPKEVLRFSPPLNLGFKKRSENDLSHLFYIQKYRIFIPGDATIPLENLLTHQLSKLPTLRLWVLGHHGSQTSTGLRWVQRLRSQHLVVSARQSRYGHPHAQVVERVLKHQKRTPISTEYWGHLRFQINH